MKLTIKQTIALDVLEDNETNEVLFGGGAGGGKSLLGVYWLLKCCFKYPNTRWLMGRSQLKNLKETTLNTLFECLKMMEIPIEEVQFNQAMGQLKFIRTGSSIILKDLGHNPSDPHFERLGSLEISGAFIDEATEIVPKAVSIVNSRMRYKLDEYGIIPKLLMTCNPVKNWIYTDYYKPHKEGTLVDYKKFIQSLVTDNPHISKHYIKQLEKLDSISRRRLLHGDWEYEDDENKIFEYDKIIDMFNNKHVEGGEKCISADIARFGKDKSVITYWEGFRLIKILTIDKSDLVTVANMIQETARNNGVPASNIVIDEDGMGSGVVDMVRGCKGFSNGGRALKGENYGNLKSQMYFKLADLVNKGDVYVLDHKYRKEIIEELEVLTIERIDNDLTKLQVMKKEKIKQFLGRSPDFADAMMMRMYLHHNKTKITYWS